MALWTFNPNSAIPISTSRNITYTIPKNRNPNPNFGTSSKPESENANNVKEILKKTTIIRNSPTHFHETWKPSTRQWTLWRIWDQDILDVFATVIDDEQIPISKTNLADLFDSCVKKLNHSFPGIQDGCFVILVKEIEFPICSNKILYSGESFIYSRISDRIEMNVQFLPFPGANQIIQKLSPTKKTLSAFSGLAQILAETSAVNDILIISGNGYHLSENKMEINLSGNRKEEDENEENWLDIIQFNLNPDEAYKKINMIEKILPLEEYPDWFQFTYNSACKKENAKPFYKEVSVFRQFVLLDKKCKKEPFKMPISANPVDALKVHTYMSRSTLLGILNYENKLIEENDLNNNLNLKINKSWSNFAQLLFCMGVLVLLYLLCYHANPILLEFLGEFFELSELN